MSDRFPLPPFPSGWFAVLDSEELPPDGVAPLRCLGQDLVAFRTEDGVAHVLDAYCPHLGAHLGHGGCVEGQAIRCPFHGWRIGVDGACASIPYADKVPPGARIRAWPVEERNGFVHIHNGPSEPTWSVPDLIDGWKPIDRGDWRIRSHPQEIAENLIDSAHFPTVHRTPSQPQLELEADRGDVLSFHSRLEMSTPRGLVAGALTGRVFGLGLHCVEFSGVVDVREIDAVTPIDGESVLFRTRFYVRDASAAARAFIDNVKAQIEQDIVIWEHKIYRANPTLCAGDGPIARFRRWARGFYPT